VSKVAKRLSWPSATNGAAAGDGRGSAGLTGHCARPRRQRPKRVFGTAMSPAKSRTFRWHLVALLTLPHCDITDEIAVGTGSRMSQRD